jgi:predicted transcriptional regulator
MSIPKVFVSYSHDSPQHKSWVLDLATRLRSSGVDAVIDQWDLRPGDDLAHFMETQLTAADRVLMVCTEKYVQKANAGVGGVGYEKMIVTAALLARIDSNKVIPLIRQAAGASLPTFLQTKLYLDFSRPDQFEFSFDELVRTLHDAPLFEKPPITKSPFPAVPKSPVPTKDGLKELMAVVTREFEANSGAYLHYTKLVSAINISRVMLDLLFAEAVQRGYLKRNTHELYQLTDKGKLYAVENGLIK